MLCNHPQIVEAAVVARPDPVLGEKVHAFVTARDEGLGDEDVRAFCRAQLADYKVPEFVTIGAEPLPRNAIGKLQKDVLRRRARRCRNDRRGDHGRRPAIWAGPLRKRSSRTATGSMAPTSRRVEPRAGLVPVRLDVTERAATFALAERAAAEAGPLKLWINAAGILRVVQVAEADAMDWERIIAVNLTGTFHGCAAALEVMGRSGGGRIVNIGSLSGQVGGTALHPAYGASKAGVHALTRTYALEGARYGVYCNAVAPSVVEGAMAAQLSERQREQLAAPIRCAGSPACPRWSTRCAISRAMPRATPTA